MTPLARKSFSPVQQEIGGFFLPKVEIKFLHGIRVELHGMALLVFIIGLNRFV